MVSKTGSITSCGKAVGEVPGIKQVITSQISFCTLGKRLFDWRYLVTNIYGVFKMHFYAKYMINPYHYDVSHNIACKMCQFKFQSCIDWAMHQIPKELIITFSSNHQFQWCFVVTNVQVCVLMQTITCKQNKGPTSCQHSRHSCCCSAVPCWFLNIISDVLCYYFSSSERSKWKHYGITQVKKMLFRFQMNSCNMSYACFLQGDYSGQSVIKGELGSMIRSHVKWYLVPFYLLMYTTSIKDYTVLKLWPLFLLQERRTFCPGNLTALILLR